MRNKQEKEKREEVTDSGSDRCAVLTEDEDEAILEEERTKKDGEYKKNSRKCESKNFYNMKEVTIEVLNEEINNYKEKDDMTHQGVRDKKEDKHKERERKEVENKEEVIETIDDNSLG